MSIIGKTCIVRTQTAGVFLGTVAKRKGKEARLTVISRLDEWKHVMPCLLSRIRCDSAGMAFKRRQS